MDAHGIITSIMIYLIVYLIFINIIAFLVCYHDKRAAIKHKRRVPENTLFFLSAIGGAFGFFASMLCFRHKTKHASFRVLVPIFCILWAFCLILIVKTLY